LAGFVGFGAAFADFHKNGYDERRKKDGGHDDYGQNDIKFRRHRASLDSGWRKKRFIYKDKFNILASDSRSTPGAMTSA